MSELIVTTNEALIAAIHDAVSSSPRAKKLADDSVKLESAQARIRALEAEARDARYLVAALIKAAGGRVELSMATVMTIDAKDQITHWDDPISGKKVYVLTELTTSETKGDANAE